RIIGRAPRRRVIGHERAAWYAERSRPTRVAERVAQVGGGPLLVQRDAVEPVLRIIGAGQHRAIGIGQRERLVGIVVARAIRLARASNRDDVLRLPPTTVIAI